MGGAASTKKAEEPTPAQLNALPGVVEQENGVALVSVLPQDEDWKRVRGAWAQPLLAALQFP